MSRKMLILLALAVIALVVTAWHSLDNGALSTLEARSKGERGNEAAKRDPPPLAPATSRESRPSPRVSQAPWASLEDRYRAGDYIWLLSNARSSPETGSYSYGIRVVSDCAQLLAAGGEGEQLAKLNTTLPANDPTRNARIAALKALFKP